LSLYSLDSFIMGDIEEMIQALAVAEREALLAGESED
jgi:protein subunit release factor A